MENLTEVKQLTANNLYSTTHWVDNAPPALNAENLTKIENAIELNRATGNDIIGELNKTQKNNLALQANINTVNSKFDALTLVSLKDPDPKDDTIVVLDGGADDN